MMMYIDNIERLEPLKFEEMNSKDDQRCFTEFVLAYPLEVS